MISKSAKRILLASALAAMAFGACSKGAGVGEAKNSAQAVVPMSVLPKDTGFVVGFSLSKIKASKMWEQFSSLINKESAKELEDFKATCGLDPFVDIDSIVIAGDKTMNEKKIVAVVKAKWDEDKLNKCATAMAEKEGEKLTVKKDGNVTEYNGGSDSFFASWIASDTAVFSPNKEYLTEVVAKKSKIEDNPAFAGLVSKVDMSAMLWGALEVPTSGEAAQAFAMAPMVTGGKVPQGAYGHLNVNSGLDARLALRFASNDDAKQTADYLTKQIETVKADPQMGSFLKSLKIEAVSQDSVASLSLTQADIDNLQKMLAPMFLGGMMGAAEAGAQPAVPGGGEMAAPGAIGGEAAAPGAAPSAAPPAAGAPTEPAPKTE